MIASVVKYKNEFASDFLISHLGPDNWYRTRWKKTDIEEMKAFIACLLFAGVTKSRHESLEQMWSSDIGLPFFRAAMSLSRFTMIMKFLRFDSKRDRGERKERDKLAPFREL